MAATFLAYVAQVLLSLAPAEKPDVSPQPPIAINTLVPARNRARNVFNGSNGVYVLPELKILELANAMMACVTPCVRLVDGRLVT